MRPGLGRARPPRSRLSRNCQITHHRRAALAGQKCAFHPEAEGAVPILSDTVYFHYPDDLGYAQPRLAYTAATPADVDRIRSLIIRSG